MAEDPQAVIEESKRLLRFHANAEKSQELLESLPQGHGSGLDADMVDGLHAAEILGKARVSSGGGGGSGNGLHVTTHAKDGSDGFDGATHQISFQFEHVASLPSVTEGRVVFLLTDGHVYVGS